MQKSRNLLSYELQKLRQTIRSNPDVFKNMDIKKREKNTDSVINDNNAYQMGSAGMLISLILWLGRHA